MKWKEAFTQQKNANMLFWIKIWMILLVLHEGFGIDQPYREVSGTSCQEIVKQPNYQSRLLCTGKDMRYHCLLNENYTMEYEVCREWKWIPKGKCAYFNTYGSGNVDERECNSTSDLLCAVKEYSSADNTEYAVCYMKKEVTTIIPEQETNTRPDVTVDGGNATLSNSTGSNDQKGRHGGDIAAAVFFGLLVPPLTATLLFFIYRYKDKIKKKRSNTTQGNMPETETLLSNDNENNAGNQRISKSNERLTPTCTQRDIPVTDMQLSIENENNAQNQQREKEKEDETSMKTPEIVDSHSSSSIPNSEEALTQNTQEIQGNECSDRESTPVNGSSEIPVQADDDMQGEKEVHVSIDVGESELSSPTQGTVEEAENESTEKDENQSNEAGNKDKDEKLHALNSRGGSIPEQGISTTSNQTPKSDINHENSRKLEDDSKISYCSTDGSVKAQSDSSEQKSYEKGSKNVTTVEDTGGSVNSSQNSYENKNMVNPSDNLTEENVDQDGNLDACKPNPNSFVETVEDDTSSSEEEEDPGGVFDDTLDSIKRKDDEEKGGSQDLQDFLEEVSTRLAKKMLYHVLKAHVTDPLSYLNDESKISLVKELLPAEYQASVNIDSNDKKSISVIYAILQLSLVEKPKSGWGQEVKDRDTGVGDDVERLYRVHTLYREIANPEQVSLSGYTRLFKVLFKAVKRLDVKGQCKEDYQEFVQKWENLQRNQWFKDNLKALHSVFKKWSY